MISFIFNSAIILNSIAIMVLILKFHRLKQHLSKIIDELVKVHLKFKDKE